MEHRAQEVSWRPSAAFRAVWSGRAGGASLPRAGPIPAFGRGKRTPSGDGEGEEERGKRARGKRKAKDR